MKLLLLLVLILALSSEAVPRRGGGGREGRRRGRGLDRCKPIKPLECRRSNRFTSLTVPHFFVDSYAEGDNDCSSYVPQDSADFEVGNLVNSVSNLCQTSGASSVRVCFMRKHDLRAILNISGLEEDEADDLDLSEADMSEFKYKGRCFQCDNGNDVDGGGEEGGEFDLGARTNRGEDGGEEENAPFIDASMFEDNEDDK